jgi:hypothetical protein
MFSSTSVYPTCNYFHDGKGGGLEFCDNFLAKNAGGIPPYNPYCFKPTADYYNDLLWA